MKNIYLLPTDKPSRLFDDGMELYFGELKNRRGHPVTSYNIYITSNEEIKEGDWCIEYDDIDKKWLNPYKPTNKSWDMVSKANYCRLRGTVKKIILTTDRELIKDGVQAIDDEFLEWFINNSNCKKVIVTNLYGDFNPIKYEYKIILPKEEPKQETLEKAAQKRFPIDHNLSILERIGLNSAANMGFIEGAKWQQERSYSEEEVFELLENLVETFNPPTDNLKKWFEQFKK